MRGRVLGIGVVVLVALAAAGAFTYKELHHSSPSACTLPGYPVALWVGDSYTAGTGAASPCRGEAALTSSALGWGMRSDAEGGTGFVADGRDNNPGFAPMIDRLANDARTIPSPAVVVIDAGRNDDTYPAGRVERAAGAYFAGLASDYPHARIEVIAPYFMNSHTGWMGPFRAWERRQAAVRGWGFVDPIARGWITTSTSRMTISDHLHPDGAGHRYIARRLSAALSPRG